MKYTCWITDALTEERCKNHKESNNIEELEIWAREEICNDPAFSYEIEDENGELV